jgi:hypothetical protein
MSGEHVRIPSVMVTQAPLGPGIVATGGVQQHSHSHPHPHHHPQAIISAQAPVQVQLPHQPQGLPPSQPPIHHSHADMAAMKLTRGTSCVLCQQRKVRCDKNKPCANCVKARVECRVIPPQPPRRRKKRLQEKDLIERLKKYETLLAENGVRFESIQAELQATGQVTGGTLGSDGADDVADLENDFEGLRASPGSSASPAVDSRSRSPPEK